MNTILNQNKCNFNVFISNEKYFLFLKYHENLRKESLNTNKQTKNTTKYGVGNPGPGMGQTRKMWLD